VGTGIGFVYFALASLFLAIWTYCGARLRGGSPEDHQVWAQGWASRGTDSFFQLLRLMRIAELECDDLERLRRPGQLIVANHPTLIDAICFMSLMPQIDCVVKTSHARNPFLAGMVQTAGYISNADGPGLVNRSVKKLAQGRSVLIFPEGTRSEPYGLNPLGRGAAHVALRSGCDPIPVTIRCEPAILYRGRAWWDVHDRPFRITLEVGDPISLSELMPEPLPAPRAARVVMAAMTEHFKRCLNIA